jgi:hypothetical protein
MIFAGFAVLSDYNLRKSAGWMTGLCAIRECDYAQNNAIRLSYFIFGTCDGLLVC